MESLEKEKTLCKGNCLTISVFQDMSAFFKDVLIMLTGNISTGVAKNRQHCWFKTLRTLVLDGLKVETGISRNTLFEIKVHKGRCDQGRFCYLFGLRQVCHYVISTGI